MSAIKQLIAEIEETRATISAHGRFVFAPEDEYGASLSRRSLENRLVRLQERLSQSLVEEETAILDYRLFSTDEGEVRMGGIGRAIAAFQTFFSTVFDAIKHGPKLRASFDAFVMDRSSFKFADGYDGSAGLIFTIKNEAELFNNDLEKAMHSVLTIAQSGGSDAIREFATVYGAAAVRKLFQWVNDHARSDLGADLKWSVSREKNEVVQITTDRFSRLKSIIEETSDVRNERIYPFGLLVDADTQQKTFHMILPSGNHIKGTISPDLPSDRYRIIDKSYHAAMQQTTTVYYATEKETIVYLLVDLSDRALG